jgi:hypothetical protein
MSTLFLPAPLNKLQPAKRPQDTNASPPHFSGLPHLHTSKERQVTGWVDHFSRSAKTFLHREKERSLKSFGLPFAKNDSYTALMNKKDKLVLKGPKVGGPIPIGSNPELPLIVKDARIAPAHAEFWVDDNGIQAIRDLGSGHVNIYRNKQRVDCSDSRFFVPVRPGDFIEMAGKKGPVYKVSTHRKLRPLDEASEIAINQDALGKIEHHPLIYPDYGNLVKPQFLQDGYRFGINLGKTKEDALRSGFINPDGSFKFPKEDRINRNTGEEQPVLFLLDRQGNLRISIEARTQLDDVRKYFAQDEILDAYGRGIPPESLTLEKASGYPVVVIPHADGTKQVLQTGGHSVLANGGGTETVGARLIGELILDDAGFVTEVNNLSGSYNQRGGYGKPKELYASGVFDTLFLDHPDFIKMNEEGLRQVARLLEEIMGKPIRSKMHIPFERHC